MHPARDPRFRHGEAWLIMRYVSDDGSDAELVANPRDGVTPFVITLRSGLTATHKGPDTRMTPGTPPPAGMRYFTDLTEARARAHAAAAWDRWAADPRWAPDLRRVYGENRDAAIAELAASYLERPGAPDLIDPSAP